MKIRYENLMPCDIVLTASPSFVGSVIRMREAGLKNALNLSVANHAGIIIPLTTCTGERPVAPVSDSAVSHKGDTPVAPTCLMAIAEMLGGGLKINPLSDYTKNGWFKNRIVAIRRFPGFEIESNADEAVNQIFKWWTEGKKYDFTGVLEYVLPFLKEKEDRFYCSEMIVQLAVIICGYGPLDVSQEGRDTVTPYDLQKSKLCSNVDYQTI